MNYIFKNNSDGIVLWDILVYVQKERRQTEATTILNRSNPNSKTGMESYSVIDTQNITQLCKQIFQNSKDKENSVAEQSNKRKNGNILSFEFENELKIRIWTK